MMRCMNRGLWGGEENVVAENQDGEDGLESCGCKRGSCCAVLCRDCFKKKHCYDDDDYDDE